jgi:hypothetical protein
MKSIITYIDLIDISRQLENNNTVQAINLMLEMHKLIYAAGSCKMPRHRHIYFWNDSTMLYAEVKGDQDYEPIMKEANGLKRAIDQICSSYAISLVGNTFPEPFPWAGYEYAAGDMSQPKTVFLRPSGLTFANCFVIEKTLGSKYKKPWYVDKEIAQKLSTTQTFYSINADLYPNNQRVVNMYDGDLWQSDLNTDE